MLDKLYRELEAGGHADRKGKGLKCPDGSLHHTVVGNALNDAVEGGLLTANPASRAHPPTAMQA